MGIEAADVLPYCGAFMYTRSDGNSSLSSLVEEVKPMFEKMPERISYNVVSLDVTK